MVLAKAFADRQAGLTRVPRKCTKAVIAKCWKHLEVVQRVDGSLGGLGTDVIHEYLRVDAGAEVASGRRVFAVVICSAAEHRIHRQES